MANLKNVDNVDNTIESIVKWIKQWFEKNGENSCAVVEITGELNSFVTAAIYVKALGKDKVCGVLMSEYKKMEKENAYDISEALGIKTVEINIGYSVDVLLNNIWTGLEYKWSEKMEKILIERVKMSVLHSVAEIVNGKVISTSNYDVFVCLNPLSVFTKVEINEIGKRLGIL